MEGERKQIELLLEKLDKLIDQQQTLEHEIDSLRKEVYQVRYKSAQGEADKIVEEKIAPKGKIQVEKSKPVMEELVQEYRVKKKQEGAQKQNVKLNFEKFIGENLINKIGIVITVIGVGIGAKFAIDNQLLNPLTRIVLGYLAGVTLLFFAIRLKEKYKNYSAVLLSGSMAIFYFITFSAYNFYDLFPQIVAFALMVVFTVFTVLAALHYQQQVIALVGMVGAYGVPFLLSDDSGRVEILLSYVSIVNIGILFIAVKKYWKILYYSSFGLTWLIFFAWYVRDYENSDHFALALVFSTIFYIIFYLTFLSYKLIKSENFNKSDIVMLILNSFIYFGLGYNILDGDNQGENYLGVFTLINAIIHFMVAIVIRQRKVADKNLFYFVLGLVLVFITITIPVQLDGNWVTLLWVGEAALMFWLGRTRKINIYEQLSYPLMVLAFISLVQDWTYLNSYYLYDEEYRFIPLFNIDFLSSFLFVAAFGLINYIHQTNQLDETSVKKWMISLMRIVMPAILLISLFFTFRIEIYNYWQQAFDDSAVEIPHPDYGQEVQYNYLLNKMRDVWLINYALFFFIVLSVFNQRKLKDRVLAIVNMAGNGLVTFLFLVDGLLKLSELREAYLWNELAEYYPPGIMYILIRYISLAFLALLIYMSFRYYKMYFKTLSNRTAYGIALHAIILWVLSSELLQWMDIFTVETNYKLGLSILWGIYALIMVVLGIWKRRKYLRISAIVLFGVTLLKLFFYDISHLNLISKAIVFISLGALLLIISFLYNRYKHTIFDDEPVES